MSKAGNGTAWAFLVVSDPQQADTLADQEAWAKELANREAGLSRVPFPASPAESAALES